jgi:hypothetical protein
MKLDLAHTKQFLKMIDNLSAFRQILCFRMNTVVSHTENSRRFWLLYAISTIFDNNTSLVQSIMMQRVQKQGCGFDCGNPPLIL